jgi:pimeloyl-ACP methyl ester carboxylesterase
MDYKTKKLKLPTGLHTYVDLGESDQTLLLLHGLSFKEGLFPLVERLNTRFRLILPDLPFAPYQEFKLDHNLENYTKFVLGLIKELNIKTVSIFGNSFGATLGLLCCLKAPMHVDKLIIRSPFWSKKQLPTYLRIKPLNKIHRFFVQSRLYASVIIKLIYKLSEKYSPPTNNIPSDLMSSLSEGKSLAKVSQCNSTYLTYFLDDLIKLDLGGDLESIQNPKLIIWGEKETLLNKNFGSQGKSLSVNANFIEMEGEYHNISTADPVILATLIHQFITTESVPRYAYNTNKK